MWAFQFLSLDIKSQFTSMKSIFIASAHYKNIYISLSIKNIRVDQFNTIVA